MVSKHCSSKHKLYNRKHDKYYLSQSNNELTMESITDKKNKIFIDIDKILLIKYYR